MKPEELDELKRYIKAQVWNAANNVVATMILLFGLTILLMFTHLK